MKRIILIPLSIAFLLAAGYTAPAQSNSGAPAAGGSTASKPALTPLEGAWHGKEVTPGQDGPATLIISGQTLDFHGGDPNDWCKGTFVLRQNADPKQFVGTITAAPGNEGIGKTVYAIYKIENGTLTITGNAPGDANIPAAFDTAGTRQFVLKRDQ